MHILEIGGSHWKDGSHQCRYCGKSFNNLEELQDHINREHKRLDDSYSDRLYNKDFFHFNLQGFLFKFYSKIISAKPEIDFQISVEESGVDERGFKNSEQFERKNKMVLEFLKSKNQKKKNVEDPPENLQFCSESMDKNFIPSKTQIN
ncbi:uncharacterized protein LOC111615275 [Centruroides sculpturatus]|uniref:uncharacterized protein LOC111615275 n=1 Tax=Centruroides sculpturatus TaxID=218467 RepID=UPI000C6EF261|nr:uncharacterized protein LOC111615275 [Centruroides sculpturatus]